VPEHTPRRKRLNNTGRLDVHTGRTVLAQARGDNRHVLRIR
jgi:hypothetical protein